jgi:glycosyltransferase involved in cell wall biosynthesis
LRIGFDARYIDDRYHGIGRFAFEMLEALTRDFPDDAFVVLHNPSRPSTRLDPRPILARPNVVPASVNWDIYHPLEQPALALAAARLRLDVFYSPYFAAPLFAPCPVVTTVHDLIFDRVPAYGSGKWVRFYYRPMMQLSARRARRVVCVSGATAVDLRALYRVPEAKTTVVTEAAGAQFRPVTDETELLRVRERYGLPARFALAVGVHRPHKNLGALVEAFGLVRERMPQDLVLVGETHARYADDVPSRVARLGLSGRVHPVGHVADEDLPAVYSLAELFVQPSLIEGFGLPVLEAMSCGTPVIASNTSSLPEVVGDAGLLADPSDPAVLGEALVRLGGNANLRSAMRTAGLNRAATFSWDRAAALLRAALVC